MPRFLEGAMKKILGLLLTLFALQAPRLGFAQGADQMGAMTKMNNDFTKEVDLSQNYFEHETKAGLIFTTGNTQSILASGASHTLWRIRRFQNTWDLGAYFNKISSSPTVPIPPGTIARYIYGVYRFDYYLTQNTTFLFGVGGYTDTIKGIDLAFQTFVGANHYFLRTPDYYLSLGGGYNFTYEDRIAPDPNVSLHSLFLMFDYQQKFNKVVSFAHTDTFLEALNETDDFRVNSDTLLKLKMTDLLAIVIGFHLRFDNDPPAGFKKLDTITDVSLSVSFQRPKPPPKDSK